VTDDTLTSNESVLTSKDPVKRLQQALRYDFSDWSLLMEALTHRSFVNETNNPLVKDNERLEFLGDAVVSLAVSTELMRRYPEAREGPLSKIRASIVSEGGLAKLATRIGLGDALRLGRGEEISGGRQKASLLADALEALMAAIYLEAGHARVAEILLPHLEFPELDDADKADPKTQLQQKIQAERHITPTYRLVTETGPEHQKTFHVEVLLGEEVAGAGEGRSKKDAEQKAAASVLARLAP